MERRLAAILAADVVGYSRLMGKDEAATLAALKAHRAELIDPKANQYNGRTIKLMGDGALMEFPSVVEAVAFAVEVQLAMSARNTDLPEARQIHYRIGINIGDIIVEGDDIYGDGVNIAARLENLAEPGGICVRRNVRNQVRDKLDLDYEDRGEIKVKNIDRPIRVFSVVLDDKAEALVTPVVAAPIKTGHRRWLAMAAVLVLGLVAAGGLAWWQPWAPEVEPVPVKRMALPLPDKPSIAVLPFANLSDDKTQEYFADGLTDDLITDLSKVSGLFVIARNSVFTFKGKPVRIQDVAKELGVRYVVEGSVRRAGDKVRVNATLIDGNTGHHVWAERYDREITDLFALQDELIRQIVSALAVQLTRIEETQLAHRPAPKFEAYDLYLQAHDGYFSGDEARMRESLELYEQAWTIDPTFARAYAGYARLAADILRLRYARLMSSPVARKAAENAAMKALALDPTIPDAYSVLALLKLVDRDHDAAVQSAQRAVALDPNSADAHTTLAVVLSYAGLPEAALETIRTAIRLNPRPPPHFWIYYGLALFLNHRYDDAIAVLEPIAEIEDRSYRLVDTPREILAMAYAQSGRLDQARTQVQALREQYPFINLALYRLYYDHHAREEDLHHRLDALGKAGVPAWPFGFDGDPDHRLNGSALQDLIFGKTWSGTDAGRELPFVEQFGEDGDVVYAAATTIMTGTALITDDELCERFEIFLAGRYGCGRVYRNPSGTSEDRNEYVYVNQATVKYFSLPE